MSEYRMCNATNHTSFFRRCLQDLICVNKHQSKWYTALITAPAALRAAKSYQGVLLQAVQTIHEARIVHSDLKPANFLMVEGQLKLIDFGIAKAISSDTTSIARESQVSSVKCISGLDPT